jgi:sulfite exporter TauE/SafE/copper chaperone CopZ
MYQENRMKIEHITIQIKGMTCTNCEKILSRELRNIKGIKSTIISYSRSTADIRYDSDIITIDLISEAIRNAGYTVKTTKTHQRFTFLRALTVLAVLFLLSQVLSRTGIFTFVPEIQSGMSLAMLFLVGIMTSVHCIAMCGGINLSAVAAGAGQKIRKKRNVQSGLLYNGGRMLSYTLTGAVAGALGQLFSLSETGKTVITLAAAVFMLLMGLNMLGLIPWIRKIRFPVFMPLRKIQARFSNGSPFFIGLFNGLMPCGPLQTMQLYALGTGSAVMGALSMLFFAAGTVPLMFGMSFLAGVLSARKNQIIKIVSAGLIIMLGLQMFGRAVDIPMLIRAGRASSSREIAGKAAVLEGEYQYVETRFENGRYQPIIVQAGIPVKWNIVAEQGDLNGCNRSIIIDDYQVGRDLQYGDNLVEFYPEKAGLVRYTCWMNMISSYITVVDDISSISG